MDDPGWADDPSAASQWPDARRGVGPLTGAREPIYRITDPLSRGHCDVGPGVDRAQPHFKHWPTPMAWHDVAIGRRSVLAGSVAGTVAAVAAAMAVGIAPIASAAPSEQHCLARHC